MWVEITLEQTTAELGEVLEKLKRSNDPHQRLALLKQLRVLVDEAYRLLQRQISR